MTVLIHAELEQHWNAEIVQTLCHCCVYTLQLSKVFTVTAPNTQSRCSQALDYGYAPSCEFGVIVICLDRSRYKAKM